MNNQYAYCGYIRFGAGAVIGTDLEESQRPTTLDDTRVFARQ